MTQHSDENNLPTINIIDHVYGENNLPTINTPSKGPRTKHDRQWRQK